MLPQSIVAQLLQDLQIVHHRLSVGRSVDAIRPEALIKRTEEEYKLAVQQWPLDAVNHASRDCAESGVTLDHVVTHCDSKIIQVRRVG